MIRAETYLALKVAKKPKPAYYKPDAVKLLETLANDEARLKHPTLPEAYRCTRNYNDHTANGLSRCIIDYCRMNGHLAERTGCTGRYIDQSKINTDVLGFTRRIGSGKWIPTSGTKGTSDLKLLINGISIACEIKMPGDRMRPDQVKYKVAFEKAGGKYYLARNFTDFKEWFDNLLR